MHAKRFFQQLQGGNVEITAAYPSKFGDTAVNLEAAAEGEHEEWAELYPAFGKVADEEGFGAVGTLFRRWPRRK
jgi:rubrerythrin